MTRVPESAPPVLMPSVPLARGVRAVMTTRAGGVSRAPYDSLNLGDHVGDDAADVAENRRRLEALGRFRTIQWLKQVHGTALVEANPGGGVATADACWTAEVALAVAVMTADCVPIALASADGSWVAGVHAGWRGLASGILDNVVSALPDEAARMRAWVGPAIGPNRYEVHADVAVPFSEQSAASVRRVSPGRAGTLGDDVWTIDLVGAARDRLRDLGVSQVHTSGVCNFDDARFFSHRRDGITGRQALLVWREAPS